MPPENNSKQDYGKETNLNFKKSRTRKVVEGMFSSPFESKDNKDILKEVSLRSHRLLYEQPQSPNPSTWSSTDIKKFMTFSEAPSTKPDDVGTEKGISSQIFEKQGSPAATYFPCLNSPGSANLSGKISDGPNINVNPPDTVKVQPEEIKKSYYVISPSETAQLLGKSSLVNATVAGMSQYSSSGKLIVFDITKNNDEY